MSKDLLRLFFLVFYAVSVLVLVVRVLPLALRSAPAERRAEGTDLYLPFLLLPIGFLIPPIAMLTRAGEVDAGWWAVRCLGVLLGFYAAVILPWSASTLGRFLVPQARVSRDHELVVEGPFRFVRHPAYSGDLALWLGSALATLNVLLMGLWPLYVLGATMQSRVEDELLAAKFGDEYRHYAARVGRFVPRLGILTPPRPAA
jgi:protein-S-isoprenylcysteine O-methyltransferase Ste14